MIDHKRLQFLERCMELSSDKWGEMVSGLLAAYYRHHDLISDEFRAALEKEIISHCEWVEEHCTVVERTETRTVTYHEIEWNK